MSKNSTAQAKPVQQSQETAKMEVVFPGKEKEKTGLQATAEDVKPTEEVKEQKPLTIDELKRKAELLTRYAKKHVELTEKRKQVENFVISHDSETATVMVHDSKGEVFNSNSPKTIGKLIEFWMEEFTEAIEETERKMREIA